MNSTGDGHDVKKVSALGGATSFCFRNQETKLCPKKMQEPEVGRMLMVINIRARSASQKNLQTQKSIKLQQ